MTRGRLLAGLLLLGIGVWLAMRFLLSGGSIVSQARKISLIMSLIQRVYVEEPNLNRLTEGAIEGMLERLDPHSVYIPATEQREIAERDNGEFQGIGISFIIQNELITVVSPIPGSPSDRLGIRAGDRIVEIDSVNAFGIKEDEVFKKLRGPKGSKVRLRIAREGVPEPLDFTVVRDDIPLFSILASFMLDDSTGYLLLNQFSATTTSELETALRRLERLGMRRLVFDLRNNGGGRLDEAVQVADMFIPAGYTLCSRRGRNGGDDSTYKSRDEGTHRYLDLIVLMNGGSASASEIVAGAFQDLDRALVVGQQSFGKGLVQSTYPFTDGSAIRLSTAHWFAPSGRIVQMPYDKGRGEYYAVRYRDQGKDAIESERTPFKTLGGRTVYGTSGVTPDSAVTEWRVGTLTAQAVGAQAIIAFARELAHQSKLSEKDDFRAFLAGYRLTSADLAGLVPAAAAKNIPLTGEQIARDSLYIATLLKAEMAQLIWNDRDAYYQVIMAADPLVVAARALFPEAARIAARWRN